MIKFQFALQLRHSLSAHLHVFCGALAADTPQARWLPLPGFPQHGNIDCIPNKTGPLRSEFLAYKDPSIPSPGVSRGKASNGSCLLPIVRPPKIPTREVENLSLRHLKVADLSASQIQ